MTAIGNEVAGRPSPTPPMKTTASRPSLPDLAEYCHKHRSNEPQNSDEWQHEHGVLLAKVLEAMSESCPFLILRFDGLCNLDTPFVLELRHAKKSRTHKCDDNSGKQGKDALPNVFRIRPYIILESVERAYEAGADDEDYCQTSNDTKPYLECGSAS